MKTLKGPELFHAQFAGDVAPFNSLAGIARWARDLGFDEVQIPGWDPRLADLARAADSDSYCDDVRGTLADAGAALTELHGFEGWAVLEWEFCLKAPEVGAREGDAFIRRHITPVTAPAFDDFADSGTDFAANRRMLGLAERSS